jgi:hypothetical protein
MSYNTDMNYFGVPIYILANTMITLAFTLLVNYRSEL